MARQKKEFHADFKQKTLSGLKDHKKSYSYLRRQEEQQDLEKKQLLAFVIKDHEKQLSIKKQDITYLRQNIARYNYDTRVEDENLVAEQQDVYNPL